MTLTTFVVYIVFVIIAIIIIVYLLQREKATNQHIEKHHWRTLVTNSLEYVEKDSSVEGDYDNCHLELYTISGDTFLYLSANNPINEVSVSEIKKTFHTPIELEQIRDLLTHQLPTLKGSIEVTINGQSIQYSQKGIEENVDYLKRLFGVFSNLINLYPRIIVLGGEIVPFLLEIVADENHTLRPLAIRWLQNIGIETKNRLGHQTSSLICPSCFVRCATHSMNILPMTPITYYGCRACGQSQEFMDFAGPIIAILDNQRSTKILNEENILVINWFAHQVVFDFERIKIVQATDEEVERFVVNVSNNSDKLQQTTYEKMDCVVWSTCNLSDNTIRILKHTFGKVEILENVKAV